MTTIHVEHLYVALGSRDVLTDINLEVNPGDLVAIVGPNGAGKSSLMRTLAGDLTPTTGSVTVGGKHIHSLGLREAGQLRSFLSQSHVAASQFTVETIVGFGQYGVVRSDPGAVAKAMDRAGVTDLAGRPFDELSGGEQRRVTIARVLCQDSPVLLLDEPTDSLDLGHAESIMATVADEARQGKTVVTTSHDLNVAARHATTMVLLAAGRTVRIGPPHHVLDPEVLSDVYATAVNVVKHPTSGVPVVIV